MHGEKHKACQPQFCLQIMKLMLVSGNGNAARVKMSDANQRVIRAVSDLHAAQVAQTRSSRFDIERTRTVSARARRQAIAVV
jgi:hypothetical protein